MVPTEIDPPQPAIGDRALDLILAGDDVARLERRLEIVGLPAARTKAFAAIDPAVAMGTDPPSARDFRILQDEFERIDARHRRQGDKSAAEPGACRDGAAR